MKLMILGWVGARGLGGEYFPLQYFIAIGVFFTGRLPSNERSTD